METSADLKVALAATARVCEKCGGSYKDVHLPGYTHYETDRGERCPGYHYGKCPHCTNGVVYSDERARELMNEMASLRAAIGFRDDILSDIREAIGEEGLLDMQVPDRITELMERLRRAEEALDTMPIQAMAIIGPPYTVTFSPSAFELIRDATSEGRSR